MPEAVSTQLFATLVPLNALKAESQASLAKSATLRQVAAGEYLFRQGDHANNALYVLQGAVQLEDIKGKPLAVIRAGDVSAAHRLAHQSPRKVSARAVEPSQIVAVDANLLDVMLTWDQTGSFEVDELSADDDTSGDWMARLLQMPTFQSVPPANLQAMFMRMEQINVEPGHVVVRQGEPGDYFYVVMEGRCVVTREAPHQIPIRLAELEAGSCFGEEALISEGTRNATVTLLTHGKLTRLAKSDFRQLLNEPLARRIPMADARQLVDSGEAQWLDVRMASEIAASPWPGAINIPLFLLRLKIGQLDARKRYIVVCDSGRRSSVAVFVLTQKGYDASMLSGGLLASAPR